MPSPARRSIGSSPIALPQHVPSATRWYSINRSEPGSTLPIISRVAGAAATHGDVRSKWKYTAPVRRTARNTSERTSAPTAELAGTDARASVADGRHGGRHLQIGGNTNRTIAHGVAPRRQLRSKVPRNQAPAPINEDMT